MSSTNPFSRVNLIRRHWYFLISFFIINFYQFDTKPSWTRCWLNCFVLSQIKCVLLISNLCLHSITTTRLSVTLVLLLQIGSHTPIELLSTELNWTELNSLNLPTLWEGDPQGLVWLSSIWSWISAVACKVSHISSYHWPLSHPHFLSLSQRVRGFYWSTINSHTHTEKTWTVNNTRANPHNALKPGYTGGITCALYVQQTNRKLMFPHTQMQWNAWCHLEFPGMHQMPSPTQHTGRNDFRPR